MQNCGSMRAEAYFDRVNTPRIVSFSKARMFHGSRSSAIPFYLLFRNSGTRQQCFASRPAICVRVFNSISNTCPRIVVLVAGAPDLRSVSKLKIRPRVLTPGTDKISFYLVTVLFNSAVPTFYRCEYLTSVRKLHQFVSYEI